MKEFIIITGAVVGAAVLIVGIAWFLMSLFHKPLDNKPFSSFK